VSPRRKASAATRVGTWNVEGELTIHTAGERKAALQALLGEAAAADGPDELEVVLADVTEMDTAGLQLLLLAKREAEHLGKPLRLRSANHVVTDLLAIAHLTTELEDVVG
jgi:anti-sigma B factor antagonist